MEINKKILSTMYGTHRVGKHLIIRLVCQKVMPEKNANCGVIRFSIQTNSIPTADNT